MPTQLSDPKSGIVEARGAKFKTSEFFQRVRGGPPSALRHARAEGDRSGGNSPPWRPPSSNMTPPHPMRNMGASPVLIGSLEASGGRRKIKKKRENKSCFTVGKLVHSGLKLDFKH